MLKQQKQRKKMTSKQKNKMNKTLGAIPYYGGKRKMAPLIVSMLDYNTTDIYMEIFGGGGAVLLNKPNHKLEIYNDGGKGVATLFELLANDMTASEIAENSDRDTAKDLIEELCKIEATEEVFLKALYDKNCIEDGILATEISQVNNILSKIDNEYRTKTRNKFQTMLRSVYELSDENINEIDVDKVLEELENKNPVADISEYNNIGYHIKNINTYILEFLYDELERVNEIDITYDKQQYKQGVNYDDKHNEKLKTKLIHKKTKEMLLSTERGKMNRIAEADHKEIMEKIEKILLVNNYIKKEDAKKITQLSNKLYKQFCNDIFKERFYYAAVLEEDLTEEEELNLAVSTFIVYTMSRDAIGEKYAGEGFSGIGGRYKYHDDYLRRVANLYQASDRLKGGDIYCGDALMFFYWRTR
jgi:site-specific DNA-adenine methylase